MSYYKCKLEACTLSDFDGDGEPDNIGFMIKRIKVHSKDAVKEDPHYRFPGNYGVEKFLEIFSGRSAMSACHSVGPGQFRLV